MGWAGLPDLKALRNVTLVSPTADVASLIRSAKARALRMDGPRRELRSPFADRHGV
jgi:hypothetical protein